LPNHLLNIQKDIKLLVRQGIKAYQEAKILLEEAKQQVEQIILGG